jgi:hypothetical protein
MMMNFAKDLHRKGELNKVEAMEKLAKKLVRGKDMGTAFLTEAYLGYDCIGLIPNKPEFIKNEGYVLYDEDLNKAVFVKDEE